MTRQNPPQWPTAFTLSLLSTDNNHTTAEAATTAPSALAVLWAVRCGLWGNDSGLFRPSGTRPYTLLQMFLFLFIDSFRHRISELPLPIAVKLCHMIAIWVRFIMLSPKIERHLPKNI